MPGVLVTTDPKDADRERVPSMARGRMDGSVVGYVSGVFDMFHIGHLNIIRRARMHCDYLIAGVVTDDVVERAKGKPPIVPLEERMAIVAALRDVDEVIIDHHVDKFDTWRELHYDRIFKGDDWKGTERANRLELDLRGVGSAVVYFPYTAHTSSTQLRRFIDAALIDTTEAIDRMLT